MPITIYGDGFITGLGNVSTTGGVTAGNVATSGSVTASSVTTGNVVFSDSTRQTSAAIGHGQTWQNVTSSRALGVNYTNSTGRPIMVMVHCTGVSPNGMGFIITVDGVIAAEGRSDASGYGPGLSVIVPPGATYSSVINLFTGVLSRWTELR